MKKFLHKFWRGFLLLRDHISGDFAYQNYLTHQQKNHRAKKVFSKKEFLRDKEKTKWNKVNRCC